MQTRTLRVARRASIATLNRALGFVAMARAAPPEDSACSVKRNAFESIGRQDRINGPNLKGLPPHYCRSFQSLRHILTSAISASRTTPSRLLRNGAIGSFGRTNKWASHSRRRVRRVASTRCPRTWCLLGGASAALPRRDRRVGQRLRSRRRAATNDIGRVVRTTGDTGLLPIISVQPITSNTIRHSLQRTTNVLGDEAGRVARPPRRALAHERHNAAHRLSLKVPYRCRSLVRASD